MNTDTTPTPRCEAITEWITFGHSDLPTLLRNLANYIDANSMKIGSDPDLVFDYDEKDGEYLVSITGKYKLDARL